MVLRELSGYGDPSPWSAQEDLARTALSFLNTTKYPPSLLYLLMTLGPALLVLAWLERRRRLVTEWLRVFGRVPLMYYVAHLYLIHALAVLTGTLQGFPVSAMRTIAFGFPEGYGFELPVVYLIWMAVVAGLYPVCRWYSELKRAGRARWWSYL